MKIQVKTYQQPLTIMPRYNGEGPCGSAASEGVPCSLKTMMLLQTGNANNSSGYREIVTANGNIYFYYSQDSNQFEKRSITSVKRYKQ